MHLMKKLLMAALLFEDFTKKLVFMYKAVGHILLGSGS